MKGRSDTGAGKPDKLGALCGGNLFSALDIEIAGLLDRLAGETGGYPLELAAALASRAVRLGDPCIELGKVAGSDLGLLVPGEKCEETFPAPPLETWREALRRSGIVSFPGGNEPLPLVLDGADRLYLYRYRRYESDLVSRVLDLAGDPPPPPDIEKASAVLAALFPAEAAGPDPAGLYPDSVDPAPDGTGTASSVPVQVSVAADHAAGAEGSEIPDVDRQKLAAAAALLGRFTVITGGPGTGKTTTVVKVLALLIDLAISGSNRPPATGAAGDPHDPGADAAGDSHDPGADAAGDSHEPSAEGTDAPPSEPDTGTGTGVAENLPPSGKPPLVALAAPTGKAAARLRETIRGALDRLAVPEEVRAAVPDEAATIHRLLGWRRHSPYFRRDRSNPLPHDIVVVDEASMMDIALSAKLLDAVRPSARLILLGDRDQLASVEAGSVLADICDAGSGPGFSELFAETASTLIGGKVPAAVEDSAPLADSIIELVKNYRFGEGSGIGRFAAAVRNGDGETAVSILTDPSVGDLEWLPPVEPGELENVLRQPVLNGFSGFLAENDPAAALVRLDRHRILCAHRVGSFGVVSVNRSVERILAGQGLLSPGFAPYPGRPVLVTENDYGQRLYNGDVGVVLPDPEAGGAGVLRVWFAGEEKSVRGIPPARLPAHETAFAMTVHKSQGSEFDHVLLLLPDRLSPILTRELLYTAVTRAREKVTILGDPDIIRHAASLRVTRASGLADRLRGA